MRKIKKFNCCPKLGKEVKIPDRRVIISILDELRKDMVNQVLLVDEAVHMLGYHLGTRFRVDVSHAESVESDQNDIDFNAYYDSGLDENGDISIELYIVTNPHNDFIILDDNGFDAIARRCADSIIHEVIHMKQSRSRDFLEVDDMAYCMVEDEVLESQLYLSNMDEIHAYGYNIAQELLDTGDLQTSLKKLEKATSIKIEDSVNLWAYVNTFAKDMDHPVLKRLIKRIYKSLYEIGKK